jgi:hypothetical protein
MGPGYWYDVKDDLVIEALTDVQPCQPGLGTPNFPELVKKWLLLP